MAQATDIAIVSGARTPMGRYCGKLREFSAQDLAASPAKGAIDRTGVNPNEFDHVVFRKRPADVRRLALWRTSCRALKAGLPIEIPALTVNRLCGSGMQSMVNAAQMIQLGEASTVWPAEWKSMSQAP